MHKFTGLFMKNRFKNLFLLILFALLLAWSFPRVSVAVLAFIAFVPLFFVIYDAAPRRAFLLSWLGVAHADRPAKYQT